MFKSIGVQCYIPKFISGSEKTNTRDFLAKGAIVDNELDRFDFYSSFINESQLQEIEFIIKYKNYDFVITYAFVPAQVNSMILNCGIKSYFLLWGNPTKDLFHGYSEATTNHILNSKSSNFLLCHKYLKNLFSESSPIQNIDNLNIPLFCNPNIINTWAKNQQEDYILIVCSRLNIPVMARHLKLLQSIIAECSDINFIICGKENESIILSQNAQTFESKSVDAIYKKMQKARLMIYTQPVIADFLSGQTLQYAPIEASCIGLPILHCSSNPINGIINCPQDHIFNVKYDGEVFYDYKEVYSKIKRILSLPKDDVIREFSYQKNLYKNYDPQKLKKHYKEYFSK